MKCSDKWLREQIKLRGICGRLIDNEPTPMEGCDFVKCGNCGLKVTEFVASEDVLSLLDLREAELREIIEECKKQPIQGPNVKIHLQLRIEAFEEVLG